MLPSLNARLRKVAPSITISAPVLGLFVVALLFIALFSAWQLRPFVLWAYNLQRATTAQAGAFHYPDPRQSDSVPILSNSDANRAAVGHLAAAIRWRPDDPYAYRLAGESYMAEGDLLNAINILERGLAEAGDDTLLGWQLALAYDQLYERTVAEAGENLVPAFANATPDAPPLQVGTPFCQSGSPESCYIGEATFTQPYAVYPDAGKVAADTLFLHPPARVTIPIEVPAGQPALTFLLGLDPQAKTWGTDGAMFQVWVIEADGGILPVYERTVIGGELTQGWVPDSIDLTPWAGQSIQLALGTTAGPLNDNRGDWIGFGNIYLTNQTIASYRALMAEGRFRHAVMGAMIPGTQLVERGDEALYTSRFDEAARWYRRAEWAGVDVRSTIAYAQFLEIQAREGWDAAFPFLESAVKLDQGWGSNLNRFYAFFNYGRWLASEEVYWASEGYLLVALAMYPDPEYPLYAAVSEVHRFLAIGYDNQGRYDEALTHAKASVTFNPNSFFTQYQYGYALFHKDPSRLPEVELAFARALEVSATANNWQTILLVWLEKEDNELARSYCETALKSYTPEQLGYTCWLGDGGASSILYNDYERLLAADDEEAALEKLESAVSSNGGWSNAGQRFRAWMAWTTYLYEEERYSETIAAGQNTLTYIPEYIPITAITLLNRMVADSMVEEARYQESLAYFQAALAEEPSPFLYFDYANALYRADSTNVGVVRATFEQAIAVAPDSADMRSRVIDFWYGEAQPAEAASLCAAPRLSAVETVLCLPEGADGSSGAAFEEYRTALADLDSEAAIEYLESAITLDRGWQRLGYRHRAWVAWGQYLATENQNREAIIALQTALEALDSTVNDEALSRANSALGLAYFAEEELDAAIAAFEQAIALNENNAFAYVHLARALYAEDENNLARARTLTTEAAELAPDDADVWRNIVSFWVFVNQPAEVDRFCQLASSEILDALGDLCWYGTLVSSSESFFEFSRLFSSDPVAAHTALEAAITTDRGWSDEEQRFTAWYYWGLWLVQQQEAEQAAAAFEKATVVAPDSITPRQLSEAYRHWGLTLGMLQQFDEGVLQAEAAIAADPTSPMPYVLKGQLLYRGDDSRIAESESAFDEAIALAPEDGNVWSTIAIFWLEQGQNDLSLQLCADLPESLNDTLSLYCWEGDEQSSTVYFNEYTTEQASGNKEAAIAALESAITVDGGWLNVTNRYLAWRAWGNYLWESRRHEEAVATFRTTLEYAPPSIAPTLLANDYFLMGLSLSSLGRVDEALDAFAESVELNPNNPWARMNYGYALYGTDVANIALTREQFATALTLAPEELRIWQEVIGFWQRNGENGEVVAVCELAAESSFAADLQPLCSAP